MNAHTAPHELRLPALSVALHLPRRATAPPSTADVAKPGWMDRLASWAERQPVHHRLGSYQRR